MDTKQIFLSGVIPIMNPFEFINQSKEKKDIYGVVVATVTNNKDPEGLGRAKVRYPWSSESGESYWARVMSFMAGKERGAFFLPEVGDEVLVAFEHGDVEYPVILGSLWSGEDKPPEKNAAGKNNIKKIRSRSGHELIFNDDKDAGQEKLEIHTAGGHQMLLDDAKGKEKITIKDKSGNTIEMDSIKNEIKIKSSMKISLEAQMIEIKANATLTLKGGIVRIN